MKIALVGCGAIAPIHIKAILETNQDIVSLCDVDINKAQALVDDFSLNSKIYTNFDQMIKNEKIDVVHICTPHYLHKEMIIAAVKQSIHVLCEKPLCISRAQYQEIEKALLNNSAQVGVCLQNRYNQTTLKVKQAITYSELVSGEGKVLWNRKGDYYLKSNWRGTWDKEGGSVLINQAIHTIDLLVHFLGEPDEVLAHYANKKHQQEIETEDEVELQCFGKKSFNLSATTSAEYDQPAYITLKTQTRDITFDSHHLTINGTTKKTGVINYEGKYVWGDGHRALIKDFYFHIKNNKPFPIDIKEAYKSLAIVFMAYSHNGKKIKIK